MDSRLQKNPLGYWEVKSRPTAQELQQYYAEKYYQESMGSYELAYTEDEILFFNSKIEQRLAVLQKYLLPREDKPYLLDVGCGEGYALAFFRQEGWMVKGFDFSSAGVKSKNFACLDALVTGNIFSVLETEIQAGKTYDVVWLQNVLEHVLDPLALLKSLRNLVSEGGVAVVTVPNDCSITQNELLSLGHVEQAFWVAPPEHLTYFDSLSLASISTEAGWEQLEMLGDFPVDWFLFNNSSNYIQNKLVGKAAHKARVQIENMIHKQPAADVISFYSALAKLGLGRNITIFLRSNGEK